MFRQLQQKYEKAVIDQIPELDRQAAEIYKKSPKEAAKFLTGFCLNNAQTVVKAWWTLGDQLLVKYDHLYQYDVEKRSYNRRFHHFPISGRKRSKPLILCLSQKGKGKGGLSYEN